MILPVANVLSEQTLNAAKELFKDHKSFEDGRRTAGWHARTIKNNRQAKSSSESDLQLDVISKELLKNDIVQAAARPRNIIKMLFSRYDAGMSYGAHVDDALMQGQRTDLSFTLFVSDKDSYQGGELVIDEPGAERAFKLDAGTMLLYPSTTLHHVAPVTEGTRAVVVGWIRSYIRHPAQRELLFDLERTIFQLRQANLTDDSLPLLLKTRSNLLRMWSTD